MVETDNIIEVPGWAINNVASDGKKIKLTLSLDYDIIGDRASNVVRGLTILQVEGCPTFVGVFSAHEGDESQSVLPQLSMVENDEESEDSSSGDFIEVN